MKDWIFLLKLVTEKIVILWSVFSIFINSIYLRLIHLIFDSIFFLVGEKCFEIDRITQELRQLKRNVSEMEQKVREFEKKSREVQQQVQATKQDIFDKENELRDYIRDINATGGVFSIKKK